MKIQPLSIQGLLLKVRLFESMNLKTLTFTLLLSMLGHALPAKNSLPSLEPGKVAQTVEELWAGYDPRTEPLDVEIIREWDEVYEEKQIKVQMLTFTVGTFKNQLSRISAYYACPMGVKEKVPGLVQVHGGGQRANKHMVEVDGLMAMPVFPSTGAAVNWKIKNLANLEQTGVRLIRPKSMSPTIFALHPMKKPLNRFTVLETTIGSSSTLRPDED